MSLLSFWQKTCAYMRKNSLFFVLALVVGLLAIFVIFRLNLRIPTVKLIQQQMSKGQVSCKPSCNRDSSLVASTMYPSPVFPLRLAPGQKYLVDQQGQPFFIVGEAAWSLIGQVSIEDARLYLDDLAARGFNTVVTTLVESYYATNAPANYYGIEPFIPANDFSSPNEAYFAHADEVISYAQSKGILVILAPNYLGCCNDGWETVLEQFNTLHDATNFGIYVGNRYKDFPNLMFTWGNDMIPSNANVSTKIDAMATAVQSVDAIHLHTFHASPGYSSWEIANQYNFNWVTVNSVYTYEPVQEAVSFNYDPDNDLNTSPPLPLFLFESHYENDWANKSPLDTRKEGYVAVLSGASGYVYGNNPIWHMNGHPVWDASDWHDHLADEGRVDMTHFMKLFASRDWSNLMPDGNNTLIVSRKDSGENYPAGALTSNNNSAIIYFPNNQTLTIDTSRINGITANVWWFNPRDGSSFLNSKVATDGFYKFTPPSNGDWILVLDNTALNLAAPGD